MVCGRMREESDREERKTMRQNKKPKKALSYKKRTGKAAPAKKPVRDFTKDIHRVLDRAGSRGVTVKYLQEMAGVRRHEQQAFLLKLVELVDKGEISQKRERFYKDSRPATAEGVVVKIAETFGFVHPDEATEDVFIPGRFLMGALPGDRVRITVKKGRGDLLEGEVLKILEEADYTFTGLFKVENGWPVIYPDSQMKGPIQIDRRSSGDAKDGDKVSARIIRRGQRHFDHRAAVTAVFGPADLASVCCEAILADNGIVKEFPAAVLEEAEKIEAKGISDKELRDRLDLRGEIIFTIDGADTKDIDDAISLSVSEKGGWYLGVHIADVSHYVRAGSQLDDEAFRRGTSVYYADKVIPMLPKALSNGICSLNPQEDRLAFSCLMELDEKGALIDFEFRKTVIRSRLKGVYSEINAIFDGSADEQIHKKYYGLEPTLLEMRRLAQTLRQEASARGSLELESTEAKFLIGEDGKIRDIVARKSGESEGMIEQFMLKANEAAARFGLSRELPFLFRVHEDPSAEKLELLSEVLTALGMDTSDIKPGVQPTQLQKILREVKGTDRQALVNVQLLRSMAKAKYSDENIGHFGLVLKEYSHFTSPIRRYPDLAIHRVMTESLKGMSAADAKRRYAKFMADAAVQSSQTEQTAMNTERRCEDCYKAEYMTAYIGEEFEGIVSGIIEKGIFVELPNTVEGMIRVTDLPGVCEYDGKLEMRDTLSGKSWRIGDSIRIQVAKADVSSGDVDFLPAKEG